jgi:alpha-tubulin suppressor-like RCC1 family protein
MRTVKWVVTVSVVVFIITTTASAAIPEGAKAIKVSGGEDHTLVLTDEKFVWGCGINAEHNQLGIGSNTWDRWTLVRVHAGEMSTASGYLEDINDIDGGWKHSLALDIDGFVWAWGDNNPWGQLGNDSTSSSPTPVKVHGPNDVGFLEGIISISAGRSGEHSLAVDCNNHAWAWGRNVEGQLGIGIHGTNQKELTPVQVHGGEMGTTYLEDITAVSAGEHHSMALDANGFVYTWGSNRWPGDGTYEEGYGKLGIHSTVDLEDTPMKVHGVGNDGFLENIVAIAAGWDHCIALEKYEVDINNPLDPNNSGRVYTWGSGFFALL